MVRGKMKDTRKRAEQRGGRRRYRFLTLAGKSEFAAGVADNDRIGDLEPQRHHNLHTPATCEQEPLHEYIYLRVHVCACVGKREGQYHQQMINPHLLTRVRLTGPERMSCRPTQYRGEPWPSDMSCGMGHDSGAELGAAAAAGAAVVPAPSEVEERGRGGGCGKMSDGEMIREGVPRAARSDSLTRRCCSGGTPREGRG